LSPIPSPTGLFPLPTWSPFYFHVFLFFKSRFYMRENMQ
jgi:hypothetical protein